MLQALGLWDNRVGLEGVQQLSKVMEENRTLQELNLHHDHSLGEGVDMLLSGWRKIVHQFAFLSHPNTSVHLTHE